MRFRKIIAAPGADAADCGHFFESSSTSSSSRHQYSPFFLLPYIFFFFPIPFMIVLSSHYSRTPSQYVQRSNSDPGSHGGPSPPLPTAARAFIFVGGDFIHHFFSSLVDSRQIVPILQLYSVLTSSSLSPQTNLGEL